VRRLCVAVIGAVLLTGCIALGTTQPSTLTVYAAASLTNALRTLQARYEAAVPGMHLIISTASSGALRAQIEQGARADIFLSADTANPAALAHDGLAEGEPVTFAANRLTIIVPADNPAGIRTPADLARYGVKIIAAIEGAPIAAYANRLVGSLARLAGYPAGFVSRYATNVVSREDDVRAVVTKIALGEGDAAIVYQTDAAASSEVATVAVPDAANVAATYAGIVIKGAAQPAAAHAFLAWLAGTPGRATLLDFGFLPPP
jgi:molybdate transport system substrate-binding protein